MSKTNYLENAILDHILKGAAFTQPANIYIGLHTADPGETGSLAAEVSGNGYARKLHNTWAAASNGQKKNTGVVTFNTASGGNWGIITHISINDALTGGNMLYKGALTVSKTINDGDTLEFQDSQITVTED